MMKYVGIKSVDARPATYGEFLGLYPDKTPKEIKIDFTAPGYIVVYKDGYTSWSPEGPFNEAYVPFLTGEQAKHAAGLIAEIDKCNFECEGSSLRMLVQYQALKELLGIPKK